MPQITDQEIAQNLEAIIADSEAKGMSEAQQIKRITDMWFDQGISLQRAVDATQYNEADMQNALRRAAEQGMPISVPGDLGLDQKGGLADVESALNAGLVSARNSATQQSNAARGRITAATGQASQELAPFKETGLQANDQLAALNGLLGPEAQAQAFADFKSSPGQQFLVEQAENALIGNASATGGLGSGDVKRELQRQRIGLAAQDFGNHVGRLESTRAGGQAAATGTAQLLGNSGMAEAGILQDLGAQISGLETANANNIASARLSTAQLLGNQAFQTGLQQAAFNQQNKLAGVNAIGAGGSDISSVIQEAARQNGNINLSEADINLALAQLGINTIPDLQAGRSDVLASGYLAGANKAGETGTKIASAMIGGV